MSEGELFVRDLGGTVLLPAWIHQSYGLDQSWALLVALAGRPTAVPLPGFTLCYCLFFLLFFPSAFVFDSFFFFFLIHRGFGWGWFFFFWLVGWLVLEEEAKLPRA